MSKNRLPPMSDFNSPGGLRGPQVLSYTVGDWCPDQHGKEPPEAVALSFEVQWNSQMTMDVVFRLKNPKAVDTMIQSLLRHKRSVWPDAP